VVNVGVPNSSDPTASNQNSQTSGPNGLQNVNVGGISMPAPQFVVVHPPDNNNSSQQVPNANGTTTNNQSADPSSSNNESRN